MEMTTICKQTRRLYYLFVICTICISLSNATSQISNNFPNDFLFGVGTSAYQTEGAWNVSGKGETIWDRLTHSNPSIVEDLSNADIASDCYHKLYEDVKLMKDMGIQLYRFSIAWSRILPEAFSYKINQDGLRYYNELIDLLLENNITPMVTMVHCDTPFALEEYGGAFNSSIVNWFEDYARVLFDNFGDRVKLWLTVNDLEFQCLLDCGLTERLVDQNLTGIFEYACAHNLLKAHARIYHLYQDDYKTIQKGKVGIVVGGEWMQPGSLNENDVLAAQRAIDFKIGLFADPIYHSNGDFPESVKAFVSERSKAEGFEMSRLEDLTEDEIKYIRGTYDFLGMNHYSTSYVIDKAADPIGAPSVDKDMRTELYFDPSWPTAGVDFRKVVPWGLRKVLKYVKDRYGDIEIYITENGYGDFGEISDFNRVKYHKEYLQSLLEAIHIDKVNVKAYVAWSLMDNFEWNFGYKVRFGLHHIDFNDTNRSRKPKLSARFYKTLIAERKLSHYSNSVNEFICAYLPSINYVDSVIVHRFC